jgi:hypothetical protein
MIQWIGIVFALFGLVYNGIKDYQNGEIKLPEINKPLTPTKYPVQYCVMAYDPNLQKVFYLHDNGTWYDFPPKIREYPDQNQEALGIVNGTPRTPGYRYGQSAQASTYTKNY